MASLGHQKKAIERGTLTSWRPHREGLVRTRKVKLTEQAALTSWGSQGEGAVRTWKEIDCAMDTHFLEKAGGATFQDTE